MLKSRKGQEGFTLIELLVVVLIIGILAAIAIPAFLGQKKGAQDANAKSLLRNAAIAMESQFSNAQDFVALRPGAVATVTETTTSVNDAMKLIEPNITWLAGSTANAKDDEVGVTLNANNDGYVLNTKSQSKNDFSWARDASAKTAKCKAAVTTAPTTAVTACPTNSW